MVPHNPVAMPNDGTLRDIVALSMLPAMWIGATPLRICESLAAALFATLAPRFVVATIAKHSGVRQITVAQVERYETNTVLAETLAPVIAEWAREHDPDDLLIVPDPGGAGTVRMTTRALGAQGELGVLAAAFKENDAPTAQHHLLLNVAAAQACMAIQNAHLIFAVKESEARFRNMADHAPVMVWVTEPDGRCSYLSKSWQAFTGQTVEEGLGHGWLDAIHSEDRQRVSDIFGAANARQEAFTIEYRLRRRDGIYRWMLDAAAPRNSVDREFLGYIGSVLDITDRKESETTKELLVNELNHRVKNTLATVQAIAHQTLRKTRDPAAFVAAFTGRIEALSRVHSLLAEATWRGTDIRDLVRELVLLGPVEEGSVTACGPAVLLDAQTSCHLALILHELCTNACKYGSLSRSGGRVMVNWNVQGNDMLALQWVERGGPKVDAIEHSGFGTVLIHHTSRAHGGSAEMQAEPEGMSWTVRVRFRINADNGTDVSAMLPRLPEAITRAAADPIAAPARTGRILIVEDEALVGLDMSTHLEGGGIEIVGPVTTKVEALRLIERVPLHAAMIDANLSGEPVDDVVNALRRRGIAFAFVTGYGASGLPRDCRSVPLLRKPFTKASLLQLAATLLQQNASVSPAIDATLLSAGSALGQSTGS